MNQNPAYSPNLTARDMPSHLGPVTSNGLMIGFFYTTVQPKRGTGYQARLCVAKAIKGDRLSISHQYTSEAEASQRWPQEWALFKQYEDVPTNGMPLRELPGITQSHIALLTVHNIRCVEDLAELSEDQVAQIGMDATRARKIALRWLADRNGQSDQIKAAEAEARADTERREMERRLNAMEQQNLKLQAVLDAVQRGQIGGRAALVAAGPVGVESDVPDLGTNADFFAGGDVATGNDDLSDYPDPLA